MYRKLFVLLYADDTVLLAETADDLQHQLYCFELYCETWKLKVNATKTKKKFQEAILKLKMFDLCIIIVK